jgi:hypothetical protein
LHWYCAICAASPHRAACYNLSFVSKLVEGTMSLKFIQHTERSGLFPVRQSAYRAHHSTETAVLSVYSDIVRAVDQKCITALVLLDLRAAFDTVDHDMQLSVLERRFAVGGSALSWFRSYLDRRTQVSALNGRQLAAFPVTCSVPQGLVLGHETFIAYTEDIVSVINRHLIQVSNNLFADDKHVYVHVGVDDVPYACTRLHSGGYMLVCIS